MTTARFDWHEADRIFDAALEVPAEQRARWLGRICARIPFYFFH